MRPPKFELQIRNAVVEGLLKLGKTADDIAATLEALGIRGKKADDCECPLAAYVLKLLAPHQSEALPLRVLVKVHYIFVDSPKDKEFIVDLDNPDYVKQFIEGMDAKECKYPNLLLVA